VFPQQQQLGVSDPNAPDQWGHWKIELAQAWAVETGKKSVVVAVMDSGINHGHPDLLCNFWVNPCDTPNGTDDACPGHPADDRADDVHGWNFWDGNAQLVDSAHHGTLIAGIIGACPNSIGIVGINQSVSLMDLKVYETVAGTGALDAVLSAIPYAAGYGAHVINASWTTAGSPKLAEAIGRAAGVIVTTAAGDAPATASGAPAALGKELVPPDTAFPCNWTLPSLSPTPVPNLICVTSSTRTDAKAATANYGAAVQIAAPGVEILSTQGDGTGEKSGTSFAAPYVAGVTALVRAHFPSLPTNQIVERVLSGDDLPTLSGVTRPKGGAPGTGSRLNACTALGCRSAPPGEPVLLP
jgi:subtilisin family serine protease